MNIKDLILNKFSKNKISVNTFWNLVGIMSGIISAFICIPFIISLLGKEKFAFITLAWALIGYFSVFDLGISRAITYIVARENKNKDLERVGNYVSTALITVLCLSCLAVSILSLVLVFFNEQVIRVEPVMFQEALNASYILLIFIPFVILFSMFRGVLEGLEKFKLLALIRSPMSIYSFGAPVAVAFFSTRLEYIVFTIGLGRVISVIILYFGVTSSGIKNFKFFSYDYLKEILSYGGWATVSNVVAPLLLYADRFIVSILLSLEAAAFYVAPFEIVTKLWIFPQAYLGVLFPEFSKAKSNQECVPYLKQSVIVLFIVLSIPTIVILCFAGLGLQLWLGAEFSAESTIIAKLLAIGILIHSLGQPAFYFIQARGRPDITSKIHIFEFVLFLFYIFPLINSFGIIGAAISWIIRVSISCTILWVSASKLIAQEDESFNKKSLSAVGSVFISPFR